MRTWINKAMRLILYLLWLGLLASCANAPLRVPIDDFDVDIALVQSNKIAFVKQRFEQPPISLSRAELEGSLTYQTGPSFVFYTTDQEPCATQTSGIYLCDPSPAFEQAGTANFQSSSTQRFKLSSNSLTRGINSGQLWIGIKLESGLATAGTLQFRNMVAQLALLP